MFLLPSIGFDSEGIRTRDSFYNKLETTCDEWQWDSLLLFPSLPLSLSLSLYSPKSRQPRRYIQLPAAITISRTFQQTATFIHSRVFSVSLWVTSIFLLLVAFESTTVTQLQRKNHEKMSKVPLVFQWHPIMT